MIFWTMRSQNSFDTASRILTRRNYLKMVRITTRPIPTEMIKLFTFWNITLEMAIHNPMNVLMTVTSVTIDANSSGPQPAPI
jgi:hypothetical protein